MESVNLVTRRPKYYIYPGLNKIIKTTMYLSDQEILSIICNHLTKDREPVTPKQVLGKERYKEIKIARFIYCYFLRRYKRYKVTTIGEILNRDHTSVCHALKTIQGWIDSKDEITDDIINLKKIFAVE